MSDVHDLIIIGGGPAGYTAALYAARANLDPLVIEGFQWGGQLMITSDVENYPGFPDGVMGPDLMALFRKQAERFGATFITDDATGVDFSERSAALARRLNPMLRFVAADVRALPVADGVCAGIVAFYSLIYGGDEATGAMLAELRRVLRHGGRFLVAVHGGTGAQRFTDYKGVAIDVELHHRQPVAFAAQVRRAGFAAESVEARPPYAFEHATERLYVAAQAV